MKVLAVFAAAVLGVCALALQSSHASVAGDNESSLKTASINLTNAQVLPEDSALVRAFIPTGSSTQKCLVTLNETTFVSLGAQVFCGVRTSPTYGTGVLITISYFNSPVPPDYGTSLTLWQQGAKYYGAPVMCETASAC
jgi:hypothetical protein